MGLFKKATKTEAKLRLAIAGPSGSGKTYSSLAIAAALGGPIAVLDTEHGSASKYADLFEFDVLELHAPYHPDKYMEAIHEASNAGYRVIILDSMSHAWNGEGGLLELVEQATKRQKTPNSYTAWHDVTPIQNKLIEAIVSANIHIIATMRSKQDYVQEKDSNGRSTIRKVGMAPIQREGFEYEFDVFFDLDIDNNAVVTKTRCPALTGTVINKPGKQVAAILTEWLKGEPAAQTSTKNVDVDFDKPTNGKHDANPFNDTTPYYVSAWRKLTGKHYDFVKWIHQLHLQGEPCSKAQYGLVTGIVDALTNNEHNYALSVLCQSEISKANMPSLMAAKALLKRLQVEIPAVGEDGKAIKDEEGKIVKVTNPDYRADMAQIVTDIAAQMVVAESVVAQ